MDLLAEFSFIKILDLFGTFAFAVSGIRLASGKNIDWFGAYVIGLVTAIGGGTIRDLLLDVKPFWMLDATYLLITGIALLVAIIFKEKLLRLGNTLFIFDTVGLGLFTTVGISKSFDAGLPFWVCIMMGAITGTVGGVIRDVLINEVPLLFRKDIYALACIAGGLVFFVCYQFDILFPVVEILAAATVIFIRLIAVKYHIQLPILNLDKTKEDRNE
ncbi:trimeric intracellular cation channel family protein [Pontibacter cellulosilyticus]|uniref:Trimeric intracellular cation channel family protein n=1 Tax=Pontibacter cellulosilyticus TaxID=1720253 RepID=A0A923N438_9BACT|nr:trimeric intracellular cation channel family protein [Pontibacter cellulosilyticus]MBC5991878.1 trimeric intracellular cation channel family protein [Pontibacter cellulosilyticus]